MIKDKLIQKVKWELPGFPKTEMYMYGEASVEANKEMQEPLEKLYQYENQPDTIKILRAYIDQLDAEIDKCKKELQKYYNSNADIGVISMQSKIDTLIEVKNDLQSRLDEVI